LVPYLASKLDCHSTNRSKTAILEHPDLTDLRSHEARAVLSRFHPLVVEMSIEDEKGLLCDGIEQPYPGHDARETRIPALLGMSG
jgi:hypothetical protein